MRSLGWALTQYDRGPYKEGHRGTHRGQRLLRHTERGWPTTRSRLALLIRLVARQWVPSLHTLISNTALKKISLPNTQEPLPPHSPYFLPFGTCLVSFVPVSHQGQAVRVFGVPGHSPWSSEPLLQVRSNVAVNHSTQQGWTGWNM